MTTIYEALQRKDGRWDYTSRNGSGTRIQAEGYCAGWRDPTPAELDELAQRFGLELRRRLEEHWQRMRPFKAKFHDDGHATAEEAEACHVEFMLDHEVRRFENHDAQHRCQIEGCGAWTQGVVVLGKLESFFLCSAHQGPDHIRAARELVHRRRLEASRS